jgi:hypothetical protein
MGLLPLFLLPTVIPLAAVAAAALDAGLAAAARLA